jgi:predicted ABC-type ATPase
MITVIAGVNGAGKSSIIGSALRHHGGHYFNPDEAARDIMNTEKCTLAEANSKAWKRGYDMLCEAVENDLDYVFETTLGGNSVPEQLHKASDSGISVSILYCGLESPDLHIQRVSERVKKGGHDIPEEKIRQRWTNSIYNLGTMIPKCDQIKLYDNSSPLEDGKPSPKLLFSMSNGNFKTTPHEKIPDWAKPIAVIAMETHLKKCDP